jgi:hypothetical protein
MRKIIAFLVLGHFIAFGQNIEQENLILPSSVWEFKKFGGFPVNEYRGLANVSIPLYKISLDEVSIPLIANYYTGGIQVSEEASQIGLGWSLKLPTIVQEIKCVNDITYTGQHRKLPPIQGNPAIPTDGPYFNNSTNMWTADITQPQTLPGYQESPYFYNCVYGRVYDHNNLFQIYKYQPMINEPYYDTEPDIFTLYLNDEEIKFCRKPSAQAPSTINQANESFIFQVINGKNEYKVEPIIDTNNYNKIKGIKIIDNYNNQYFFDKKNDNFSDLESSFNKNFVEYNLTKILTNKSKTILFNYNDLIITKETPKFSKEYALNMSSNLSSEICLSTLLPSSPQGGDYYSCNLFDNDYLTDWNGISKFSPQHPTVGNTIPFLFGLDYGYNSISSIVTPNETINFNYSSRIDYFNMKKLDNFEVKNNLNQRIKKVNFNYEYFVTNQQTNGYSLNFPNDDANSIEYNNTKTLRANNRLKLLSIVVDSNDPYVFEYDNEILPSKNSYSVDYWGFYNGSNNLNMIPNISMLGYPNYQNNSTTNFASNINFSRACSLKKIIYPTKGYTLFEYESHIFDNLLFTNSQNTPIINTGGGLRISSITNFNFNDLIISKKKYNYFLGKNISKRVIIKELYEYYGKCNPPSGEQYRYSNRYLSFNGNKNFISSTGTAEPEYIGYDRVEILEVNENNQNNGKIIKYFSNFENIVINPGGSNNHNAVYTFNKNLIKNGNLIKEDFLGNDNYILLKKEYKYVNKGLSEQWYGMNKKPNGYRVFQPHIFGNIPNLCDNLVVYPVVLLTFYPIYDFTSKLSEIKTTEFFNGSSITKRENYEYDYYNNLVSKTNYLLPNTLLSSEQKEFTHLSNPSHSQNNILSLLKSITIKENNVLKSKSDFEYSYINTNVVALNKMNYLFDTDLNSINKKVVFYDLYDDKSNLLQFHDENGIFTTFIWGYNKSYIIAKIENIQYTSISPSIITNLQNLSNTGTEENLITALNDLRLNFPNALVTTYTHKPLIGVSTITDPKGDKQTYQYDNFNRLQFVKDSSGNILSENEYHYKN